MAWVHYNVYINIYNIDIMGVLCGYYGYCIDIMAQCIDIMCILYVCTTISILWVYFMCALLYGCTCTTIRVYCFCVLYECTTMCVYYYMDVL